MKAMIPKSVLKGRREKEQARKLLVLWGDPVLKQMCEPVSDFGEAAEIMEKMRRVLLAYPKAVGISAPQVGYARRIIAIFPLRAKMRFMINPALEAGEGRMLIGREGCLSYPGIMTPIARHEIISVSYSDAEGVEHKQVKFFGWDARVIQHELDHLEGRCRVME